MLINPHFLLLTLYVNRQCCLLNTKVVAGVDKGKIEEVICTYAAASELSMSAVFMNCLCSL